MGWGFTVMVVFCLLVVEAGWSTILLRAWRDFGYGAVDCIDWLLPGPQLPTDLGFDPQWRALSNSMTALK